MSNESLIGLSKFKEAILQTSNGITSALTSVARNAGVPAESLNVVEGVANAGAQVVATATEMAVAGTASFIQELSSNLKPEQVNRAASAMMNFFTGAPQTGPKLVEDFIGGLREAGLGAFGGEIDYIGNLGQYITDNLSKLGNTTMKLATGGYGVPGTQGFNYAEPVIEIMNAGDDLLVPGIVDLNTVPDKIVNGYLDSSAQALLNSDDEVMRKIGALMAGTRESFQFGVYAPQYAFNGSKSLLNDMYTDTLRGWNKIKGVDNYGNHLGGKYVSMGDSVQSGWGLDGYMKYNKYIVANENVEGSTPMLVGEGLGADTTQLHMPGLRTTEMLYMLADSPEFLKALGWDDWMLDSGILGEASEGQYSREQLDAMKDTYRQAVAEADVITLDIGFNDIWAGIAIPFGEVFHDFATGQASLEKLPQYASHFVDGLLSGGLYSPSYYVNYFLLTRAIHKINPNATLVLCGGYNPEAGWDIDDLIPGVDIDDNLMDYFFQTYWDIRDLYKRAVAFTYPGECVYVDMTGTEINMGQAKIGGVSLNENGFNPHPTQNGAIEMSTRILQALGAEPITNVTYDQREIANQFARDFIAKLQKSTGGAIPTLEAEVPKVVEAMMSGDTTRLAEQIGSTAAKAGIDISKDAAGFYETYLEDGYEGIVKQRELGKNSNNIPDIIDDAKGYIENSDNWTTTDTGKAVRDVAAQGVSTVEGIRDGLHTAMNDPTVQGIGNGINTAHQAVTGLAEKLSDISGRGIADGIWQGGTDAIKGAIGAAAGIGTGIMKGAMGAAGQIGSAISGAANGGTMQFPQMPNGSGLPDIRQGIGNIQDAIGSMKDNILNQIGNNQGEGSNRYVSLGDSLGGTPLSNISELIGKAKEQTGGGSEIIGSAMNPNVGPGMPGPDYRFNPDTGTFDRIGNNIMDTLGQYAPSNGSDALKGAIGAATGIQNGIIQGAVGAAGLGSDIMKGAMNTAGQIGSSIVNNTNDTIREIGSAIMNNNNATAQRIIDSIPGSRGGGMTGPTGGESSSSGGSSSSSGSGSSSSGGSSSSSSGGSSYDGGSSSSSGSGSSSSGNGSSYGGGSSSSSGSGSSSSGSGSSYDGGNSSAYDGGSSSSSGSGSSSSGGSSSSSGSGSSSSGGSSSSSGSGSSSGGGSSSSGKAVNHDPNNYYYSSKYDE